MFFYLGVFLITASTLILQVVQTRILSVVAWYYLAFFVISMAMFGLTMGAVWVYVKRDRFTEKTLFDDLANFSVLYSIATTGALLFQLAVPTVVILTATVLVSWSLLALALAVPFFFSGMIVSLALTRSPFPVGRVYGVDLVGAAFGCLVALALISATDGPSVVLWTAAMGAAASFAFSRSQAAAEGAHRESPASAVVRWRGTVLAATCLAALVNGMIDRGLVPVFVKGTIESTTPLYRKWNSFSRVMVSQNFVNEPGMWGPSPTFRGADWRIGQRYLNIDGDAATFAYELRGDLSKAEFLKYDVTNVAHYLPGHATGAVIGVGGGRDMVSARLFGVTDVTGVEINPTFVHLLQDPPFSDFVGVDRIGGMTFVVDEARSWFARSDKSFDIIQMSLIDTWAATGAGAFTLSENSLYTLEAWQIFMRHLTPRGIFTVSRWYQPENPFETSRMISLAMATLLSRGAAEPRRHIIVAASDRIATLMLSPTPFSQEDLATVASVTSRMRFEVLVAPHVEPRSPELQQILATTDLDALYAATSDADLDETPATDERPFFFNQLPLYNPIKTLRLGLLGNELGQVVDGNLRATATLVILFLISLALVIATIILPLRSALTDVGGGLVVHGTIYFMLIGMGFMSIEIGLLQRMSVFLGHPIYSLSIVLFSLILATGLGSLASDTFPLNTAARLVGWPLLVAVYFGAALVLLPAVTAMYDGDPLAVRAGIAVALIGPGGFLMGWGFPTGMRLVSRVDRTPTPWFWGINGAAGVLASSMAVACSIAFGISTTIAIGAVCYLLLIPAALSMWRAGRAAGRNRVDEPLEAAG